MRWAPKDTSTARIIGSLYGTKIGTTLLDTSEKDFILGGIYKVLFMLV